MNTGCSNDTNYFDVVVLDQSTGVTNNILESIKIYPNPIGEMFFIEGLNQYEGKIEIRILDMTGRIVHLQSIDSNRDKITIPSQKLSKGTYELQIISDNNRFSYKLIR